MAVPKKKMSKRRSGMRKAINTKVNPIIMSKCPKCGEPKASHIVCMTCGYYGDKKVLEVESKLDKKIRKEQKAKEKEEK
jgi:large subunit ribosomal protein L32